LQGSAEILTAGMDGLLMTWRARSPYAARGGPGAHTNLRVCPVSFAVLPIVPFPVADTVWAPEGVCPK
jgi:hypothetical protein